MFPFGGGGSGARVGRAGSGKVFGIAAAKRGMGPTERAVWAWGRFREYLGGDSENA